MAKLDKSDVIKNVFRVLISISGRKTTTQYAVMTLDTLIKQLEPQYDFLKHVQINDDIYSEDSEIVNVMVDINAVAPTEMGKAIHAIITSLNESLGDRAGHFFIKEVQSTLGDDYVSTMKDMGVDLSLMQLEDEVTKWERMVTRRRK